MQPAPRAAPRLAWRLLRWALIAAIWGGLSAAMLLLWFARDLPRPDAALDAARRPSLTLLDRAGHPFARFGDVVGEPLRLSDLPPYLPQAVIAIEDRRFWSHPGIDITGLLRAALVDLRAGHVVQGGSTITQQVAKTLFLSNARTFRRKLQELLLTLWLEHSFSKQEILEIWLNRVYLGSGTWGIDAAARLYFGVSARRLTLWQAAMLAGVPRAPSRFNPRTDPQAAAARARAVLAAMVQTGALDAAQAAAASRAIDLATRPAPQAGWYADWTAEQAQAVVPDGQDAVLHTALDPRLQAVMEARIAALLDGPGAASGVTQAAAVVLDAGDGAVRAMAGGRDYRLSPFNRAVLARRQPGSAFKPFVWLAALERGMQPGDLVLDAPLRVGTWAPADFERRYLGEISLEEALAQSINTVAVRLLLRAGGPRAIAAIAHRLGIAEKLPDNASLALGTGEVGLLELAAAYAPFFNGGMAVTPHAVAAVQAGGLTRIVPPADPVRVIDPDLAALMQQMLMAVVERGTGRAAALPGRDVAGKTGTTQDYRDAWFVGWVRAQGEMSAGTVIAVWLGNDDNQPMRSVAGGGLPARLFHAIAEAVR